MPASHKRCYRVKTHCRPASPRMKKAGSCTHSPSGRRGVIVRSFYAPKAKCNSAVLKLQARARGMSARKKSAKPSGSSAKKKKKYKRSMSQLTKMYSFTGRKKSKKKKKSKK